MKYNFDIELILNMINVEGKMLKEVQQYYGCGRSSLGKFIKQNGLNLKNNPNARRNQSKLMKGNKNPTKGRKRTAKEMEGIKKANIAKARENWNKKFKEGISYYQYAKICRGLASKHFKEKKEGYEIDHIFSLKDCWKNKLHPDIASHKNNLRLITIAENKQKSCKSEITLNELLSIVDVQRLSKAQFNWKQVE